MVQTGWNGIDWRKPGGVFSKNENYAEQSPTGECRGGPRLRAWGHLIGRVRGALQASVSVDGTGRPPAGASRAKPMNRNEVLDVLRTHMPALEERFGVTRLALFGSFARDQATDRSDVDVLVQFDSPATSRSYFGVQFYIEDLLGRPVDLVTDKALRPEIRPRVEREAVHV